MPPDAGPSEVFGALLYETRAIGDRPSDEGARADWYQRIVESRGHAFRTGPNEMNMIGLRGFDHQTGFHDNAFNAFNDTLVFVWRDADGVRHVREFDATTDPGQRYGSSPDVSGDGVGDVAHILPGQYEYRVGSHKGRFGAGNPIENVPVARDTNHDGEISYLENHASITRGDVGIRHQHSRRPGPRR